MTAILGLSAFYHDSAAALVVDGRIVAAAQEERFSRKKHDAGFPARAAEFCLGEAGLRPRDLDAVVFYDKPLRKLDRLLETHVAFAPRGFLAFADALPVWIRQKLRLPREIRRGLGGRYNGPLLFTEHHEAHAASAFFPSPFDEAAILTIDGVGEWATATLGVGRGNRIELLEELSFPHSLGLLYAAFTAYCGFRINSGEYKLMGLAPYGRPIYKDLILHRLIDLKDDGSFRLDQRYFAYCHGRCMTSRHFHRLFGGSPRRPETPVTQRDMDLAASIQVVTEEVVLRMARHAADRTGMRRLVMAGGVALNCVANTRLWREGPFSEIWVQPAAGDAGGALGAALFVWHQLLGKPRVAEPSDSMRGAFLGPEYAETEIADLLQRRSPRCEAQPRNALPGRLCRPRGGASPPVRSQAESGNEEVGSFADKSDLPDAVASLLADGKVVAWFLGRCEFGPRALGARSILADPRDPAMPARLNEKVKLRESFRPFAPVVLREHAHEWFDVPKGAALPYMLFTAPVRRPLALPAVTHVDGSARVQTVDECRHGRFCRLLRRFHQLTGCPVLINTSFNIRGEPPVCSPADALRCFHHTDIDALVLGDRLLVKGEPTAPAEAEAYRAEFALD